MIVLKKGIKIVAVTIGALVILLVSTLAILHHQQDRLVQKLVSHLNSGFSGQLKIENSRISPFKSFPYISIDLQNVRFYESKEDLGQPIYAAEDIYVGFSILEILRGNYEIRSIRISNGELNLVQNAEGELNILLAKGFADAAEKASEAENDDFSLSLRQVVVEQFRIQKLDESSGQTIKANIGKVKTGFSITKGHIFTDFFAEFVLDVIEKDDSSIFRDKHFILDGLLDFDNATGILKIEKGKIGLEDALFSATGSVNFNDDFDTNIRLRGDKPDFNLLIAFFPNEVAENIRRYRNRGNIFFEGTIQGKAAVGHTPQIEFRFGCENAFFLNPDVDKRIDALAFKGYYTNGEGRSLASSEFHLLDFMAVPEEGVFRGNFIVKNFEDPYISMNLHSELDLEFLGAFFGFEGLKQLRGRVILDMDFNELIDLTIPENQLVKLKEGVDSELIIENLSFEIPGHPHAIRNMNARAQMQNGEVRLDSIKFRFGASDFHASGYLSDLPAIFHKHNQKIKAGMRIKSDLCVIQELLAFDQDLATKSQEVLKDTHLQFDFETSVQDLLEAVHLPKGNFYLRDLDIKFKNYPHALHDFRADIHICDTALVVRDFYGEIDESDFHFSGLLKNYALWFDDVKNGKTKFEFDLDSRQLILHDLLTYEGENYLPEDYRNEEIRELKLHGEIDLNYENSFKSFDLKLDRFKGRLKIHPLKFEDFMARVHFEDSLLDIEHFSGKMGNSDFALQMKYYTGAERDKKKAMNQMHFSSAWLDLDQLMNYNPNEDTVHEEAFNIFEVPFTDMKVSANIDHMRYHQIVLDSFKTQLRITEDHFLHIDTMQLLISDGRMGMKGYFNGSDPEKIYFKSDIHARDVSLDQLMFKLDNFGQDFMLSDNMQGKVSGTISSMILVHPDFTPIIHEGEAQMDLTIRNGELINFAPIMAMSSFFQDRNLRRVRFDTLSNKLTLKNGVLNIPNMNINSSLGYMEISGQQSLDLNMEYFVRIPLQMVTQVGFRTLFSGKNRDEVDPEQEDAIETRDRDRRVRFLNLRISGNPDDYKISLGRDRRQAVVL
ncbi:MAG: AsmA family protein [Cyclobacteriaceae bacterium]|nr:AsmA family protein [Cyclobacteriaceae bacterium]